jgi:ketosteroid isomerase-like protein
MPQGNVEIVGAVIEAFNRGDSDAMFTDAAPELEFELSRLTGPNRGVQGLDEVRRVWKEFVGIWAHAWINAEEFIEADEHVAVFGSFHAIGRDWTEVRARFTWTFAIRDGAIQRVCMYRERQDALAATGLAE